MGHSAKCLAARNRAVLGGRTIERACRVESVCGARDARRWVSRACCHALIIK